MAQRQSCHKTQSEQLKNGIKDQPCGNAYLAVQDPALQKVSFGRSRKPPPAYPRNSRTGKSTEFFRSGLLYLRKSLSSKEDNEAWYFAPVCGYRSASVTAWRSKLAFVSKERTLLSKSFTQLLDEWQDGAGSVRRGPTLNSVVYLAIKPANASAPT